LEEGKRSWIFDLVKAAGSPKPTRERRKIFMNMKTLIYSSIWTRFCLIIAVLGLLLQGCAHTPTSEIKVPSITKEEVKPLIGNPDLIILDVRSAQDWKDSDWKIKGAIREDRKGEVSTWMDKYPKDKTLVLYCS
jgi:hypothetical protein